MCLSYLVIAKAAISFSIVMEMTQFVLLTNKCLLYWLILAYSVLGAAQASIWQLISFVYFMLCRGIFYLYYM